MESNFSADTFFASQPEPADLQHNLGRVEAFLKEQTQENRRVVLITVSLYLHRFAPGFHSHSSRAVELLYLWNIMCRAVCSERPARNKLMLKG